MDDKWTMFFGDLYKNTANAVQVRIQPEGRNAFYKYIHDSLAPQTLRHNGIRE